MKLIRKFKGVKISNPLDMVNMVSKHVPTWEQECFLTAFLNNSHEVIVSIVSLGTVNRATIHPRDVFREACRQNAESLIVAHTHPSGKLEASREDEECTKRFVEAGKILGIRVLDHVIITKKGYLSMRESMDYSHMFTEG